MSIRLFYGRIFQGPYADVITLRIFFQKHVSWPDLGAIVFAGVGLTYGLSPFLQRDRAL